MNRDLACTIGACIIILSPVLLSGCGNVRTVTRRDIHGRPVTVTIRTDASGKEVRTTTRGEKPLPIEGYKFGGKPVAISSDGSSPPPRRGRVPSRSIFGGGGKWYVNGKAVDAPSQSLPQAPVQGPQPEPKPDAPQ